MTQVVSPSELAEGLRAARRELLEAVAELSETRVYRATDRDGWTVKHELAYLAAGDHVLLALLEELRVSRSDAPVVLAADEVALRRLRGQYMHVAHEMRLAPLSELLTTLGEETAAAVESQAASLERSVVLGGPPAAAVAHAAAHLDRAREGAKRIRAAIG